MASAQMCQLAPLGAILRFSAYPPVFPCLRNAIVDAAGKIVKGAKSPHTAHGFQDASKDAEIITAWWTRWPDALVGVPTGEVTGLVVIDVDSHRLDEAG